ncbi:MAG: prephenate dehydratase [Patescibacteria group bacterium]|nr:prephenate dehydratase [Patescibacteria group bacterium]
MKDLLKIKIHIIGGTGQMGSWLKNFLESQKLEVTISGKSGVNNTLFKKAEIIFICVPISVAPKVILQTAKLVKKNTLLVDLSSANNKTAKSLKKTGLPSLTVHFLFGPTVTSLQNQKVVFCPIKNSSLIDKLRKIFEEAGARVLEMTPQEHDFQMAHIQGLTHFANLILAKVLIKNGIDLTGTVSTPVFLGQISTISRVISQDPELLTEIQLGNPYSLKIINLFNKYARDLEELINQKDRLVIEKEFAKIHQDIEPMPFSVPLTKMNKKVGTVKLPKVKASVGFLGPKGTFSNQAVLKVTDEKIHHLIPLPSVYEIFAAVSAGKVDFGIVPAENSIEGSVRETLDFLVDFNLKVNFSTEIPVHQNLLAKGKKLDNLKKIISHPQALAQCRSWLRNNLPQAKLESAASTLAAVADMDDSSMAMIGPSLAAKIYDLQLLAKDIEDNQNNFTKFFIISKQPIRGITSEKTLLMLTVFNRVGILRDILSVFADSEINLNKIESRPSREKIWDYSFFIEVEVNQNDPHFIQTTNILRQYCPVVKVLGGI